MKARGGRLLAGSIALSAALHALLFLPWHVLHSHAEPPELMELDLAGPPGPPAGARSRPARASAPATEWKLAADSAAPAATAPVESTGPDPGDADAPSEGPAGAGGGGRGGTVRPPVLLNHGELHRLLQRLYPDSERELGREGMVVLSLSIGADGRVSGAEISRSAGAAFDAAALRLSAELRYAPAEDAGRPMAVRMRQAVLFKLER